MKQTIRISALAATLLLSTTLTLSAQTAPLKDDVAAKAAKAINSSAEISGDHAARAAVEEANNKESFEAKMAAGTFAQDARAARADQLGKALNREATHHVDPGKDVPQSILEGISLTLQSVQIIQSGDTSLAIKALEKASDDFQSALKANPKLDWVPFSQEIQVRTFAGDAAIIQKALDTAISMLKAHRTQDARAMVSPLQDEMDFITQLLPMKTYPVATRKAADLLKEGKTKEALSLLGSAFESVAVTVDIIPLPLMLAQEDILAASQIDPAKKAEIKTLLNDAQEELRRATLLGYTGKHDAAYRDLKKQIETLQKAIDGGNKVIQLFDTLKTDIQKLFRATRSDTTTLEKKARQAVQHYQATQNVQAQKKSPEFEKAAQKDANKTVR